jgi:hypothetical protein
MSDRKREKKVSDPKMLAARMDKAHAEGAVMDLDYEEVTGVIDVALERSNARTDAAISTVRGMIAGLRPRPA